MIISSPRIKSDTMPSRRETTRQKNFRLDVEMIRRMDDYRALHKAVHGYMLTEAQIVQAALAEYFQKWEPHLAAWADAKDLADDAPPGPMPKLKIGKRKK